LVSPLESEEFFIDQRKIVDYLLAEGHPTGRAKLRYFRSFGFRVNDWRILHDALIAHARSNPVELRVDSEFGVKFIVSGPLPSPDKRNPVIRSVWIRRNDETAIRFVTAYPVRGASDDQ
jgi:hypothetical protein